jgi:hypothetical protein
MSAQIEAVSRREIASDKNGSENANDRFSCVDSDAFAISPRASRANASTQIDIEGDLHPQKTGTPIGRHGSFSELPSRGVIAGNVNARMRPTWVTSSPGT